MSHRPSSVDAELPPYAISLAARARSNGLAIYAGAGLSFAQPTELPNGSQLAELVHNRLVGAFPILHGVSSSDLVAISDAVTSMAGGEDALHQAIVTVAEFTSADPAYGHEVLALLLLEGVVDVLTTNWDDCIERGYERERVHAVVNEHDLLHMSGPTTLKIHGCATQPSSLLLTSADLSSPPLWVVDQTRARLGSSVVVFVGIGDVAGYVRARLTEAIADVGAIDNIRVVSPGVVSTWESSQWAEVVPELPQESRIAATSDEFLERLASAYIYLSLADMRQALVGAGTHAAAIGNAVDALSRHDAVAVLSWARRSGVAAKPGLSMLQGLAATNAILALGVLAGDSIKLGESDTIQTSAGPIQTLIAVDPVPVTRLQREARNRFKRLQNSGAEIPRFLISGGVGWSKDVEMMPDDIFGEASGDDILEGPVSSRPELVRAEEVIAS